MERFTGYREALPVKDLSAGESMWKVSWLLSDSKEILNHGYCDCKNKRFHVEQEQAEKGSRHYSAHSTLSEEQKQL